MDKDFQNAEELVKLIASFGIEYMKKNDPYIQHVCKIFVNTIHQFKEHSQSEIMIKKWEFYLSSLQKKIPLEKDKFSKSIPPDIEQLISSIKKDSSMYSFKNGWESGIFYDYYQKRLKLYKQYATWKEWQKMINETKDIPINKLIEDEIKEGIDVRKGLIIETKP